MSSKRALAALRLLLMLGCAQTAAASSIVTEWLDETVPAANQVAWEPTVGARFFTIVHTAMYDAWTAYDPAAVGVFTGRALRGAGGAANIANKREAVSHAAYEVLHELAPVRRHALQERMALLGYEVDAASPAAIVGRRAARAVLAAARRDGANQEADYQDTTGYEPRRAATASSWHPIDALGAPQLPVSPHWSRVMPFALQRADQFRPDPPPAPGSVQWEAQIRQLEQISARLTDEQKASAEFWIPWGESPPAHMMELTKFISARDDLRIDDEVKLFFLVSIALHDTAIAVWEAKYHYDYVRPITAIQALGNVRLQAWQPPQLPVAFAYSAPATRSLVSSVTKQSNFTGEIPAKDWQPYLSTPAFPAYVSGHSAFTAAWARIVELMTGRAEFGLRASVRRLYTEQRLLDHPVEFEFPLLWSAAEASGLSRIYGGIHWPVDNQQGLLMGKAVAEHAWQRGQQFFLGTASPFAAAANNLSSMYWHVTERSEGVTAAENGHLQAELAPKTKVAWQSVVLDPVPAGSYEMMFSVALTGTSSASVRISVRSALQSDIVFASSSASLISGDLRPVKVDWTSDGSAPSQVNVEVHGGGSAAGFELTKIELSRLWPQVAGMPRYRAMRDVVLSPSAQPGP